MHAVESKKAVICEPVKQPDLETEDNLKKRFLFIWHTVVVFVDFELD